MAGQPIEVDQRTLARTADASATPASVLAAEIKALVLAGEREAARDRFGSLVALLQRRALRLAYHYLRDSADADEAVQDAFVKVRAWRAPSRPRRRSSSRGRPPR
jgi:hypothetical protein